MSGQPAGGEPAPCPRFCDGQHRHGRTRHAGIIGAVALGGDAALAVVLVQLAAAPEPRIDLMRDRDGRVDVTTLTMAEALHLFEILAAALVEAGVSPTPERTPDAVEDDGGDGEPGHWSALSLPPQNAGGFPTPWTMVRHA